MKDLAVYVHIPFCVKKCNYCDFLSFSASKELQKSYIECLLSEIKQAASDCEDYIIRSVFLGGGTPSLPDAVCIMKIMDKLHEFYKFADDAEITMEMNPGTVNEDKIRIYKESGINRISIGMQSSKDDELKVLGRIHNNETFLECYKKVREAGFNNVNIDVLSALPGQSFESYMETLKQVVELNPEHISAYSLIIEEGTPFFDLYGDVDIKAKVPLPTEEVERAMYHATKSFLLDNGYKRYEISNYAKYRDKDYSCRHNKAYWTGVDYIGFGIGASSMMNHVRWSNIREIDRYIDILKLSDDLSYKNIRTEIDELDIRARMEEFMFLGLRLTEGISLQEFENEFETDIRKIYDKIIDKHIKEELLEIDGDRLKLTERGMDVSNYVMADFLLG